MSLFLWKLLVVLRFILVLVPETGYIHPDEFFQSVEVVAGDILGLKVERSWEFNSEYPLRSILVPYTIIGFPLTLLKEISRVSEDLCGLSLLTAYTVLVLPRLVMTFLSLVIDYSAFRVCRLRRKANHSNCLIVLSSSYVILTYLTRTLSNSVETVLFSYLFYLVSSSTKEQQANKRQLSQYASKIGVVVALGFFNRPTFVVYSAVPIATWILKQDRWAARIVNVTIAFLITSIFIAASDTVYYAGVWPQSLTDIVVTPLNFIRYNTDGTNLAKHGLHPPYMHILVNMPLLFGILAAFLLFENVKLIRYLFSGKIGDVRAVDKLCVCSAVVPLLLLSLFAHQEPRFIIPLLLPLVLLSADRVVKKFKSVWIGFNVLGFVFYGVVHQGGVVSSLLYIQEIRPTAPVIFYHTYMPPRFLLLNDDTKPQITLHDLMGAESDILIKNVQQQLTEAGVIVVSPTTLRKFIMRAKLKNYEIIVNTTFYLHLSLEDPPSMGFAALEQLGLDLLLIKLKEPT